MISISGTASDWVMGIVLSFCCPVLELIFYLWSTIFHDEGSQSYGDVAFIMLFFPLLYPLYVVSLIIQTLNLVTRLDLKGKKLSNKQLPICYYETQLPDLPSETSESGSSQSKSVEHIHVPTIDVKVIRVVGLKKFLHPNHLPIIQIQLQNVVANCGHCLREGKENFLYSENLLRYPLKQLQLTDTDPIEMTVFALDKDILTGRNEVVAFAVVSSEEVREWIANGRYEGKIPFDHGRGSIQVVISTCFQAPQGIGVSLPERPAIPFHLPKDSRKSYRKSDLDPKVCLLSPPSPSHDE
jgi:hypothetical protein